MNDRKKSVFFQMRRFHNNIKRNFIAKYSANNKTVLDLACGKGGDLPKYIDTGFDYIEGYDNDAESIREAKTRKEFFISKTKRNVDVRLYEMDLLVEQVKSKVKFDLIVSNFAFHYFFNSVDNIMKSITENSKKGTIVLLTLLDKDRVETYNHENLKITKVDKDRICVFIKDSVLDKPRVEYLVSKESLVNLFKKHDFKVVCINQFSDFYGEWVSDKKNKPLSTIEKKYSFMNNSYVFEKL